MASVIADASVIVSDRLVRRPLREARWNFASLEPLTAAAVKRAWAAAHRKASELLKATPQQKLLLDSPFFLDEAIKDGRPAPRAASLYRFFERHCSLSPPEILAAARAAFEMYSRFRARTFQLADFKQIAGARVANKLLHADVLVANDADDTAYFNHHLHHDFLASAWFGKPRNCGTITISMGLRCAQARSTRSHSLLNRSSHQRRTISSGMCMTGTRMCRLHAIIRFGL